MRKFFIYKQYPWNWKRKGNDNQTQHFWLYYNAEETTPKSKWHNESQFLGCHYSPSGLRKWVLFSAQLFKDPDSFHLTPVLFSRSCNLLHVMSRWAETRGGIHLFHSHSIDQSWGICLPNYNGRLNNAVYCVPRKKRKEMNVAGAAGASAMGLLDPLPSFPSTLNQINITSRK